MRRVVLALVLLSGCQEWPAPVIESISPSEMSASTATTLALDTELPLPTVVDYAQGTLEVDTRVTVEVGALEVPVLERSGKGVLTVQVPSLLEPGSHDVKVTLGDGRSAVRTGGLTVLPGQWPDGYVFDDIPPQQRLVPFTLTVYATGPNAASFRGNVRFDVGAGATIGPRVSAPFVDGVLTQQVVLDSTRSSVVVRVSDLAGNEGTSNEVTLR